MLKIYISANLKLVHLIVQYNGILFKSLNTMMSLSSM